VAVMASTMGDGGSEPALGAPAGVLKGLVSSSVLQPI
jgi:hypothetical protein